MFALTQQSCLGKLNLPGMVKSSPSFYECSVVGVYLGQVLSPPNRGSLFSISGWSWRMGLHGTMQAGPLRFLTSASMALRSRMAANVLWAGGAGGTEIVRQTGTGRLRARAAWGQGCVGPGRGRGHLQEGLAG